MKEAIYPKVSIITVCYNAEATIEQTIKSVIHQTYQNIEYIIVDGKSVDDTMEIVGRYADKITHIISEKDSGIYDAMNKGIHLATGDWIGIVNADDWYELDAVEKVIHIINKASKKYGVVSGQHNVIRNQEKIRCSCPREIDKIWEGMPLSHPSTFVKREMYDLYGKFNTTFAISGDYEFIFRLYKNHVEFLIVDDVFVNFREGGISTNPDKKCLLYEEDIRILERYRKYYPENQYISRCIEEKISQKNFMLASKEDIISAVYRILSSTEDNIFLFGLGYWGNEIMHKFLWANIKIKGIIDNDSNKWGKEMEGIAVSSVKLLENAAGVVFVCVWDAPDTIVKQIRMINSRIQCVPIKTLFEEYF